MKLLVCIPAYNESPAIADVITGIPGEVPGIDGIRVVVVDDGSTDDTAAIAQGLGATVVQHRRNWGVGSAFQTMARLALESGAGILVTIDGDGQFRSQDIPALIAPILLGRAEVCTASRFMNPGMVPRMPRAKLWGNRRVSALVSLLAGERLYDVSCGFRAYSREALLHLTSYSSFTYTHETLLDLAAKQLPICEVPLTVRGEREFGESRVASSLVRYGWRTGLIILRFYRDHLPCQMCLILAAPLILCGLCLLGLSLAVFLQEGSWLKWAALSGGGLLGAALQVIFFGFLADISSRLRRNQEEIVYWLRRMATEHAAPDGPGSDFGSRGRREPGRMPTRSTGGCPSP
jgi:glycosyltransferase involved in cell wall biosynthesis